MAELSDLSSDLHAEGEDLDNLVATAASLRPATPAPGWTIAHQVGHLAWTDSVAALAATDGRAFAALLPVLARNPACVDDAAARWGARPDLLKAWREGRRRLADALASTPREARVPWFGPSMSPVSMATARLMETWAHGQDVADALGVVREPTARLRHVAHLGVRTRDFAFMARGQAVPDGPFFVGLTGPGGVVWSWGPADAGQRVTGTALDFCLLVTRRRHRADLALTAAGPDADRWLDIAQAFAGPPGAGRTAGQFR